jgi:hypothetical protein
MMQSILSDFNTLFFPHDGDNDSSLGLWEKNMFMYGWGILFTCLSIYLFEEELVENPYIFIEIFHKEPLLPYIVMSNAFMGELLVFFVANVR